MRTDTIRKVIPLFLLSIIIAVGPGPNDHDITDGTGAIEEPEGLQDDVPHPPTRSDPVIHITSNQALLDLASANGWPGTGTKIDPVIISGLNIDAQEGEHCIYMDSVDLHWIIEDCNITNANITSDGEGIYLTETDNGVIRNNNISHCNDGIDIGISDNILIEDNVLFKIEDNSIIVASGSNITIGPNELFDTGTPLSIQRSENSEIDGLKVDKPHLSYNFIYARYCSSISIKNCTIRGSDTGIQIWDSSSVLVRDCELVGAGTGLHMWSVSSSEVTSCVFRENTYGLILYGEHNPLTKVFNNSFLGNHQSTDEYDVEKIQARQDSSDSYFYEPDLKIGNYWSDWRGPDNERDGTVDNPYTVEVMGSDKYPLMEPTIDLSPAVKNLTAEPMDSSVLLKWDPLPSGYFNSTIKGYQITRWKGALDPLDIKIGPGQNTFLDGGLINGVEYNHSIRAVTEYGPGKKGPIVSSVPDGTGPIVSISEPRSDDYFNTSTISMEWTGVDPESGVSKYLVRDSGEGPWIDVGRNTSYTFRGLEEGPHSFELYCLNGVGITGDDSVDVIVDTIPPVLSMEHEPHVIAASNNMLLQWDTSDSGSGLDMMETKLGSGEWIERDVSTALVVNFLAQGDTSFQIRIRDRAGNNVEGRVNITVDWTPPDVTIVSPVEGSLMNKTALTVLCDISDDVTGVADQYIILDRGEQVIQRQGSRFGFTGLSDGVHQITIRAVDGAGNEGLETVSFEIDATAPRIINFSPNGSNVGTEEQIWAQASEFLMDGTVNINVSGLKGYSLLESDLLTFVPNGSLEYGRHYEVVISGSDLAGNPMPMFRWNFSTDPMGLITGKLVGPYGDPIYGADIYMDGEKVAKSDNSGRFFLSGIMGLHEIHIISQGEEVFRKNVTIVAGKEVDLKWITVGEKEEVEEEKDNTSLIFALAATALLVILIMFIATALFVHWRHQRHTIRQEDREQMLEILRHFDVKTKIDEIDCYEILGLDRDARSKEIKKAYRKLATRYHPDRAHINGEFDDDEAHRMMRRLNASKTILLDDEKRELHDRILRATGRY